MGTLLGLLDSGPRPSREPQPSLADLDGLISRMRDAGLSVELVIEGQRRALPAALELSAFRVVQEGLTNTLKHAGPAHLRALLRYGEDELEIDVADDGAGASNGGQPARPGRHPRARRGLRRAARGRAAARRRLDAHASFPLGR